VSNSAPFKLLFPAYMMAIGAAILLISPVILEFSAFRRNNLIGGNMTRARDLLKTGQLKQDARDESMREYIRSREAIQALRPKAAPAQQP
jgi:hypothetical protein